MRFPHLVRLVCADVNAAIVLGCAPVVDQTSGLRPGWRRGLSLLPTNLWCGSFWWEHDPTSVCANSRKDYQVWKQPESPNSFLRVIYLFFLNWWWNKANGSRKWQRAGWLACRWMTRGWHTMTGKHTKAEHVECRRNGELQAGEAARYSSDLHTGKHTTITKALKKAAEKQAVTLVKQHWRRG